MFLVPMSALAEEQTHYCYIAMRERTVEVIGGGNLHTAAQPDATILHHIRCAANDNETIPQWPWSIADFT